MDQVIEILQKLKPWQRILAVVGVCLILMIPFYFFVVADLWTEIVEKEKAISKVQMDIKTEEEVLRQGPALKEKIASLEAQLNTMVESLPEKQDIEELLKTITNLLTEYSLVSSKFVPGAEAPNAQLQYATIPVSISVRGDYKKLFSFFAQLKALPRVVNVPTVSFKPAGGLSPVESDLSRKLGVVPVDAEITGHTFRRLTREEVERLTKQPGKKGK
jgi:Tfp pilus assembly protein PilO